jgi:TonB family protein
LNNNYTFIKIFEMKSILVSLIMVLAYFTGISQELNFDVRGTYARPVKAEKLQHIETLSDLIRGYGSSWISEYMAVEVAATNNGTVIKALSPDDTLSPDQKNLLKAADLGTEIVVEVTYKYANPVTHHLDLRQMYYAATVVPETEAEYLGGYERMKDYLRETAINKINEEDTKELKQALLNFTINEEGEVADARITMSSGDQKIDRLLLKAINKMPKWRPAALANGTKVSQTFQFSVGSIGC